MSNYTKSTNFATKDNLTPGDPLKVVRGTEIDTEFNNIATAIATKTDNSAAAITGGSITGITDLAVADGGTGASTAAAALNNLLPSQTSNANKYLQTDGTNATWDAVSLSTADITGTLGVANGGTGVTSSTGTGNVVLSNSPTLVTPVLGTPASGTATNLTGLPISTGVSGLGTGVATFLGTPSSANLASAVSDETGTGALVFANTPTLVTPILGTPTSATLTNATGLPISTGVSGLGTGVATALAVNVGSSGAPLVNGGVLGTPSSGTATNLTGLPLTTGVTGTLPTANGGTNLTSFTSGGVVYASSSSALATGSALQFDGSQFSVLTAGNSPVQFSSSSASNTLIQLTNSNASKDLISRFRQNGGAGNWWDLTMEGSTNGFTFDYNDGEMLRITSAGNVGIGTSSPTQKLTVAGGIASTTGISALAASTAFFDFSGGNARFAAVSGTTGTAAPILFSQYSSNGSVGRDAAIIDSSGNLGLGVTPSAWAGITGAALEIASNGAAFLLGTGSQLFLGNNAFYGSSGWVYKRTAGASYAYQASGQHQWYTAPSGTAGTTISFTQAMTLDASGNLLVGTTSDAIGGNRVLVQSAATANNNRTFSVYNTAATSTTAFANRIAQLSSLGSGADVTLHFTDQAAYNCYIGMGSGNLYFATNGTTERARIDSSGNLLVGTTSNSIYPSRGYFAGTSAYGGLSVSAPGDGSGYPVYFVDSNATSASQQMVHFDRGSTTVGYITTTNTTTSYSSASDYRLKNTIAPITGALAKVALLKPCTYKWNIDGSDGQGFIAHELQEVCPIAVHGTKDAIDADGKPDYQGVDTSFLVATLTAAIQELKAEFDAYKASHP